MPIRHRPPGRYARTRVARHGLRRVPAFRAPRISLSLSNYGGDDIDTIKFPHNTEEICETPVGPSVFGTDTMPIKLSSSDRAIANHVYDHWGQSLINTKPHRMSALFVEIRRLPA